MIAYRLCPGDNNSQLTDSRLDTGSKLSQNCGRWLQPPATWVPATLESRELMAISLRRISGLKVGRSVGTGCGLCVVLRG